MKHKTLTIIIVVMLLTLIPLLFLINKIFFAPTNNNDKSIKCYSISVDTITTTKEVSPSLYLASDKESLKQVEARYDINLSKNFNHFKEYKNDTFVYFIQFHSKNSIGNSKDATDFIIDKYNAYFIYDYPDIAMLEETDSHSSDKTTTEKSKRKISIAAVPKESIDSKYNIFSEKYIDNENKQWKIIYKD